MTPQQSWSFVVLCYNEAGNIRRVIEDIQNVMPELSIGSGQIIVINDGSTDESDEILREMLKEQHFEYVHHVNNQGIGLGLRTGYQIATMENVVMVPGDGQFNVRELIPFKQIQKGTFLSFYRSENTEYSVYRKFLSGVNRWLNRALFGIELKDVNWINVYKTRELQALDLQQKSSLIETEIAYKLMQTGFQPVQIESRYLPAKAGQSSGGSFKIVKQALFAMPKLWLDLVLTK